MAESPDYSVHTLHPYAGTDYVDFLQESPAAPTLYKSLDELPPFTLLLPFDPSMDNQAVMKALPKILMTLRYTDEKRYLITSAALKRDSHEQDRVSRDLQTLGSRCEFAAKWIYKPAINAGGYLKVVRGPVVSGPDLEEYKIPFFFIRPCERDQDKIDVKTIFYRLEDLPPSALLLPPPTDLLVALRDPDPVGKQELPENRRQGSTCSIGGFTEEPFFLFCDDLDDGHQLRIDGLPDNTRDLVAYSFRALRHYRVRHVFSSLLFSFFKDEDIWNSDAMRDPRFADLPFSLHGEWLDPETKIDTRNLKRQPDLGFDHRQPLNWKSLFTIQFNPYHFVRYSPLDMSASSTEFRLVKVNLSDRLDLQRDWTFSTVRLDDEGYPPYFVIEDGHALSINPYCPCTAVRLDGEDVYIPRYVLRHTLDVYESDSQKPEKIYLFLQDVCVNRHNKEERKYYHDKLERIHRQALAVTYVQKVGNDVSLSRSNREASKVYKPLKRDSRQIRLLRFTGDDAQGLDLTAPLNVELITTEIEEAPGFIALSYVWGDIIEIGTIEIDKEKFNITSTLQQALRNLRRVSNGRYIWVDYLCIHQQDLDERASQLGFINEIYKSSQLVFACLGDMKEDHSITFDLLANMMDSSCESWLSDENLTSDEQLMEIFIKEIRTLIETPCHFENIRAVLKAPWWTRLWILQEAVLAKSLVLFTGVSSIRWETLAISIRILQYFFYGKDAKKEFSQSVAAQSLEALIAFPAEVYFRRGQQLSSTSGLGSVKDWFIAHLSQLSARGYSEPRDIIYAAKMLTPNAPNISPNYELSIMEVYRNAARAIIEDRDDLKILSYVLFSRRRHERIWDSTGDVSTGHEWYWPSWVPDWRSRGWGVGCVTYKLGDMIGGRQLAFYASGSLSASVTFSTDSKILHTSGILVGTVKEVAQPIGDPVSDEDGIEWDVMELPRPNDRPTYIAGGTWVRAWAQTCKVMDRELYRAPNMSPGRVLGTHFSSQPIEGPQPGQTKYGDMHDEMETASDITADPNKVVRLQQVIRVDGGKIKQKIWHTMSLDSGYVGFGGYAIRSGDLVCVLRGGSYPFVLRKRKDGLYHLVSDSCKQPL